MNDPKNDPKNKPRGHVFDGIEEYDNDLPRWWVVLFILTIIFSGAYLVWYETSFFSSKSLTDEYEQAVADAQEFEKSRAAATDGADGSPAGFDYIKAVADNALVNAGKETYTQICASCHGAQGEGLVGPNLTDDFWLHGHKVANLEQVVMIGIPEKGMPAWKDILGQDKIRQIVAFIKTIQRTNPPNPKAPQGAAGGLEFE